MFIHIDIYVYVGLYIHIYIYIYIHEIIERDLAQVPQSAWLALRQAGGGGDALNLDMSVDHVCRGPS